MSAAPTVFDPRPVLTGDRLSGWRCTQCRYPSAQEFYACPVCRGAMEETTFTTTGTVFASTCLRVRVPGHQPPFAVAYVVLEDGPRILTHTLGDQPLAPGGTARVTGVSQSGDLVAESMEEAQ